MRPIRTPLSTQDAVSEEGWTPSDAAPGTVLVVDDHPEVRLLVSEILRSRDYRVLTAGDGAEALETVQRESPDVILLDVMMPKLDGFEVCRRLKGSDRTRLIPIVMMTALEEREAKLRAIEGGADDLLNKPLDQQELLVRVASSLRLKRYTDELENAEAVLFALALSVEAKDRYTEGHCDRLARLSVGLGACLGLGKRELKILKRAAVLHDIGKISIADGVLNKLERLTEAEWGMIRQHTIFGETLCKPLRTLGSVLPLIRSHHERRDGSGYPDGLKGDEIPRLAQILQVADIYDALNSRRPYRAAFSQPEAFRMLRLEAEKGWRERALVEQFISSIGEARVQGRLL